MEGILGQYNEQWWGGKPVATRPNISTTCALTTTLKDRVMEGWEKSRWSSHRAQKPNMWSYFGRTQRNILKEGLAGRGEGLGRKKRGSAFQAGRTRGATIALRQQAWVEGSDLVQLRDGTWGGKDRKLRKGIWGQSVMNFKCKMYLHLFICFYLDALFWRQQKEHMVRTEGHRETELLETAVEVRVDVGHHRAS